MDEELEQYLSYREKLWTDSIDRINFNMIKMYQAQGEFEQSLNFVGQRQNELIKQHLKTQEWYLFDKGEGGSTGKPEPSIPEYTPSNANYKYEPINLKPSKHQIRKKIGFIPFSLSFPFSISPSLSIFSVLPS